MAGGSQGRAVLWASAAVSARVDSGGRSAVGEGEAAAGTRAGSKRQRRMTQREACSWRAAAAAGGAAWTDEEDGCRRIGQVEGREHVSRARSKSVGVRLPGVRLPGVGRCRSAGQDAGGYGGRYR